MKCTSCGAENAEEARFCKSCGDPLPEGDDDVTAPMSPVDEEMEMRRMNGDFNDTETDASYPEERKRPKPTVAVIAVAAAILLIVAGGVGVRYARRASLRRAADVARAEGYYDKSYKAYKLLYEKTQKESDKEAMHEAKELSKDERTMEKAKDALRDEDYLEALEAYVEVKRHDNDLSDVADEGIDEAVDGAKEKIRALNDAQEFDEATGLLSELIAVAPRNKRLVALKEETSGKRERADREQSDRKVDAAQREASAANAAASAAKAAASAEKKVKRASEGSRILYTTQYVTSSSANVRSGPGKGYPVIYTLDYGSPVYVIDTQADSVRTWCNIGDGWISYRTLNGEL